MAISRIKVWVAEVLTYSDLNAEFNNVLNNALSLISPLTGNLAAGSFKITELGAGTSLTDAASVTQVQDGFGSYLTSVAGTNTVTATATPTPVYAIGQRFTFVPANTNTGATTLNISSVGAGAVQQGGAALAGGELRASYPVTVLVTAATPVFEIISPQGPMSDAVPIVKGSADGTKQVRFEVDGLTTGTTRVLTAPNADGTIALTNATGGQLISETFYGVVSGATVTMTIASPCVVTLPAGQVLAHNMPIVFTTSGALPTGIVSGTTYYVIQPAAGGVFNISATKGGTVINTTGSQSGTHTANNPVYNKATNSPTAIGVELIGAGGGGGGVSAQAGAAAGGGGGGGYVRCFVPFANITAGDLAITVGAGGTAGSNAGGNGGVGGTTQMLIGGNPNAVGGSGGVGSTAASTSKQGGYGGLGSTSFTTVTGNYLCGQGNPGGNSISTAAAASSAGGNGGSSVYSGGALAPAGVTGPGLNGTNNQAGSTTNFAAGAGGSGALGASANVGGIGAPGLIIIREYS